jgi:hypothetical protein
MKYLRSFYTLIDIFLISILIFPSHLRVSLPIGLFPSGIPIELKDAFLSLYIRATCPALLIPFDLITGIAFGDGRIVRCILENTLKA